MNIDIAMGVIEEIASKLGVPAEQIVPEMSKLNIAQNTFMCVMLSIVFLILIAGIIILVKKSKDPDSELELIIALLCGVCIVIAIGAAICGFDLVGWMTSPQAKTIEYVLQYMN
nr:MAG TPA: hypothetical protein [Caudoviricetes sp.]